MCASVVGVYVLFLRVISVGVVGVFVLVLRGYICWC